MANWYSSMRQTYEFYEVDPYTWKNKRKIDTITSCNIKWDSSLQTLGSATIECTGDIDECYVRIYLVINQNGVTERIPLGTFMIQSPSIQFDGKISKVSLDAYSPLIELKEKMPPIGYTVMKDEVIMNRAVALCGENMRAPVGNVTNEDKLKSNFVANPDDTWLSFISDLINNADYRFELDGMGTLLFSPIQDIASLRPVWTFDDNNSSILLPDITDSRDLYGIPNVIEVVYTRDDGKVLTSRIVNDYENSPTSTVNRGREILYRDTNPSFPGVAEQAMVDKYAENLLRNFSCLEHTITFSHGYCGVRVGDCVRLNYKRAGLIDVKAQIKTQTIKCATGCTVEATAVYTTQLWTKEN